MPDLVLKRPKLHNNFIFRIVYFLPLFLFFDFPVSHFVNLPATRTDRKVKFRRRTSVREVGSASRVSQVKLTR